MPELQVPRMLWFAFLITQLVFVGVGRAVGPVSDAPPDVVVLAVIAAAGVMPPLGLLVMAPKVFGKSPAQTAWIIKFALCEAIGMFGLAVHLLGGPTAMALALHGLSIVALITQVPTADRFTRWEMGRIDVNGQG